MDAKLRNTERQALTGDLDAEVRHLAERVRVGVSGLTVTCGDVAWPKGNFECREGKVPVHDGVIYPGRAGPTMAVIGEADCSVCGGTGRVRFEWEKRLELMAYCGSEVAQILIGPGPHTWLAKAFEIAGGEVEGYLDHILGVGFANWQHGLPYWSGAMLRAAVAAAECALLTLPPWKREPYICPMGGGPVPSETPELTAITAARRYVEDPTAENLEAIRVLCEDTASGEIDTEWVWRTLLACYTTTGNHAADAISAVAKIATEEDVRAAIQDELIVWSLGKP